MTDMTERAQETVARLREDVFYGDARLYNMDRHNPLHLQAADLLEAIAARLAEVEAERDSLSTIFTTQAEELQAAEAELARVMAREAGPTFYIDCEFDGHNGPLLSIAMVRGDGWGLHVEVADVVVEDPWVLDNIVPILAAHKAPLSCRCRPHEVGRQLRHFIGGCQRPTIIADSPVDIGRFCRAISTGEDGGWASNGYPGMAFIVRNVDCYPTTLQGAVQHNAWWDAMALRAALSAHEAKDACK